MGPPAPGCNARANSAALANRSAATGASAWVIACSTLSGTLGRTLAHPRHLAAEPLGDHRLRRGSGERRLAGQHLVEHRAQAVHVGPGVEVPVSRSPAPGSCRSGCPRSCLSRVSWSSPPLSARAIPKSATSVLPVLREEQVLGFDVAVDDAVLVRVLERPGGIRGYPERDLDGKLALAAQPVAEALPFDEGHGEPELPGGLRPSRARSGCVGAGAGRPISISRWKRSGPSVWASSGWSTLSATGPLVPEIVRQVDGGHAATPELAFDLVAVAQGVDQGAVRCCHGGARWGRLNLACGVGDG